jgi:hypothetical protein
MSSSRFEAAFDMVRVFSKDRLVPMLTIAVCVTIPSFSQATKPLQDAGIIPSDPKALVRHVVDALGGGSVLARVKSTKAVSTRHAKTPYGDATIEVEQFTVFPDHIFMTTKLPQGTGVTVLTPAESFTTTSGKIQDLPTSAREDAARIIRLGIIYVAQHADDPQYGFSLKGPEKIGPLTTAVMEVSSGVDKTTWNVDPSTGIIVRASMLTRGFNGMTLSTFDYSDWRKVDGVLVPFKIVENGAISAVDEVHVVEFNPALPANVFERPAASSRLAAISPSTAALSSRGAGEKNDFRVGGQWNFELSEDKLTGAQYRLFVLNATERISDGISYDFPSFVIMCGGASNSSKWINSKLISPVVLGSANHTSPLGAPQQTIYLRSDDKIHVHFWNIAEDFRALYVDKAATKELLNSSTTRIQFRDASGHNQVAMFSPSGLDRNRLGQECGDSFK